MQRRPSAIRSPLRIAALRIIGLVFALMALGGPAPARAATDAQLARAQELLDSGDADQIAQAARMLESLVAENDGDPRALMLRGNARIMLGAAAAGQEDLERSLALDPKQRSGWLTLGALAMAAGRYEAAVDAMGKAHALDPKAPDGSLNLGAALLLAGRLEDATARFQEYLAVTGNGAEAHYLIATNYAFAGYSALAIEHLRRAVSQEERYRRQARTEGAFQPLAGDAAFDRLLNTDSYRPPEGAYRAQWDFRVAYNPGDGRLLGAVIDGLTEAGISFDPRVEVAPDWALLWGDLRIKVTNTVENGRTRGRVELSAAAQSLSPSDWQRATERLRAAVERLL